MEPLIWNFATGLIFAITVPGGMWLFKTAVQHGQRLAAIEQRQESDHELLVEIRDDIKSLMQAK